MLTSEGKDVTKNNAPRSMTAGHSPKPFASFAPQRIQQQFPLALVETDGALRRQVQELLLGVTEHHGCVRIEIQEFPCR